MLPFKGTFINPTHDRRSKSGQHRPLYQWYDELFVCFKTLLIMRTEQNRYKMANYLHTCSGFSSCVKKILSSSAKMRCSAARLSRSLSQASSALADAGLPP